MLLPETQAGENHVPMTSNGWFRLLRGIRHVLNSLGQPPWGQHMLAFNVEDGFFRIS